MVDRRETVIGPPRMWLTVFSIDGSRESVEVMGSRFVIGRDESCDLTIEDPKVSRQHAIIAPGGVGVRELQDLGSVNGVLVNGVRVRAPVGFAPTERGRAELHGGELILIGDTRLVATLEDPRSVTPPGGGS